MKLLMISGDRSLAQGKQGAFWQTLEGLSKHFDRIDVLCPRGGEERALFRNVFVHPSPWPLPLQPLFIAREGSRLLREHGHQVMTVHEFPPFYNGLGARRLKRLTGIAACEEIHHLVGEPIAADWKESLLRPLNGLLPRVTSYADGVRVVNGAVRDRLISLGVPAEKTAVVSSLYLRLDALAPATTAAKYDLVFCGRLVPNKGLITVITALAKLPGATLLVVGDGPERAGAEMHAKTLGIADRVMFAGWLPGPIDIADALRSAKVFVLNSLSEGGPRVLLEAMACGLPVATTRVGIAPETVTESINGTFHDGTAAGLAAALKPLLADDALRATMGTAGRAVAERYEYEKNIAAYADYLRSLAR